MLSVPTLAGFLSTVIFAASTLPMLVKAYRSRDLASYSLGNIALANLGNAVHSVYVYSLPPGADLAAAHVLPGQLRADARLVPALRAASTCPFRRRTNGWIARCGARRRRPRQAW